MKTVQFVSGARNSLYTTTIPGAERWCFNSYRGYRLRFPDAITTYTRWFNLHSKAHMLRKYPEVYDWYKEQVKPVYLQEAQSDIPHSVTFPRAELQEHFGEAGHYFTSSVAWCMALAIYEKFERIELWGVEISETSQHAYQRPCMAYWVQRARDAGIDVFLPEGVDYGAPGNPKSYTGPLYGYETT